MVSSPITRTASATRGRGQRGRPRLKSRGSSSLAVSSRHSRPDTSPAAAASPSRRSAAVTTVTSASISTTTTTTTTVTADDTPSSARRRPVYQNGYRPGGPGGGGRYFHPETREPISAQAWKNMMGSAPRRRRKAEDIAASVPSTPAATASMKSSRAAATRTPSILAPPPPTPAIHMLPTSDGVHKPREERSYTDFHPGFDLNQELVVFSAEEVDGEHYKPPVEPEVKSVKILDVKEEEEMRKAELGGTRATSEGGRHDTVPTMGSSDLQDAEKSEKVGFQGFTGGAGVATPETIPHVLNGTANGQGDSAIPDGSPMSLGPSMESYMASPPPSLSAHPSEPLPIDPALAQISQPQTPAITPTEPSVADDAENTQSLEPVTPGLDPARKGKSRQVDDTPTLASRRPQRSNTGTKQRPAAAPATSRRARSQKEQTCWAVEQLNLPKPSYREIKPYQFSEAAWSQKVGSTGPRGVNNPTSAISEKMKALGYQHTAYFSRPDTLLRGRPDPGIDEELGSADAPDLVEYDMDEQDDKWLLSVNSLRSTYQYGPVTPEIFEFTMTKIEKKWHALEKRMPKVVAKSSAHGSRRRSSGRTGDDDDEDDGNEDSKCAICDDGECENSNAIVFCDGCNLAVHQECYGVPYIPEGQWLCRKCLHLPGRQKAECVFCPNTEGAFKQTQNLRWAHLLCAIWIPEVRLANQAYMEPVDGLESVPKSRWRLSCYICKQKMGACIQCSNKTCYLAFHVTCGRRAKLHMKMKNTSGPGAQLESSGLKAYCDKHVPPDWREENDTDNAIIDAMDYYQTTMAGREWGDSQTKALSFPSTSREDEDMDMHTTGSRGTYSHRRKRRRMAPPPNFVWKLPSGSPVIPRTLFNDIVESLSQFDVANAEQYVADACKYWTLKRESRRGASLLKRLQLQMDSFTSVEVTRKDYAAAGHNRGEQQLENRREFAELLEKELGNFVDNIVDINSKQTDRVRDVERFRDEVDRMMFPEIWLIRETLDKAQGLDEDNTFELGLGHIRDRLEHRLYPSFLAFCTDLRSVLQSSPTDPQLDYDVQVDDYVPPLLYKTSSSPTKTGAVIGKKLLESLQPLLDHATRQGLSAKKMNGTARKQKLSEVVRDFYTQPRPTTGDNRPESPSDQLAKEAPMSNFVASQRALSPVPATFLGSVLVNADKALRSGQWDDFERGINHFVPPKLGRKPTRPSPPANSTMAPRVEDVGTPAAQEVPKIADVSPPPAFPMPTPVPTYNPSPKDEETVEKVEDRPAETGPPNSNTNLNVFLPNQQISLSNMAQDEEMQDAPGEEVDDEDAPGEPVAEDIVDAGGHGTHSKPAVLAMPQIDVQDEEMYDEDAPGEEIDEEEEAFSIARATSTVPTTPAASLTPIPFSGSFSVTPLLPSPAPHTPAAVTNAEEMEMYDEDAEGEPDDDATLIPQFPSPSATSHEAAPSNSLAPQPTAANLPAPESESVVNAITTSDPNPIETAIPNPVGQGTDPQAAVIFEPVRPEPVTLASQNSVLSSLSSLSEPASTSPRTPGPTTRTTATPERSAVDSGASEHVEREPIPSNPISSELEKLEDGDEKPRAFESPIIQSLFPESTTTKHEDPAPDTLVAENDTNIILALDAPANEIIPEPSPEESNCVNAKMTPNIKSDTVATSVLRESIEVPTRLPVAPSPPLVPETSGEKVLTLTNKAADLTMPTVDPTAEKPASARVEKTIVPEPAQPALQPPIERMPEHPADSLDPKPHTSPAKRSNIRKKEPTPAEAPLSVIGIVEGFARDDNAAKAHTGRARSGSDIKISYKRSITPRTELPLLAPRPPAALKRLPTEPEHHLVVDPPTRLPEMDTRGIEKAGPDDLLAGFRPEDLPSPTLVQFPSDVEDLVSEKSFNDLIGDDGLLVSEGFASNPVPASDGHDDDTMSETSFLSDPPSEVDDNIEQRLRRESLARRASSSPGLSSVGGNREEKAALAAGEEPATPAPRRSVRQNSLRAVDLPATVPAKKTTPPPTRRGGARKTKGSVGGGRRTSTG